MKRTYAFATLVIILSASTASYASCADLGHLETAAKTKALLESYVEGDRFSGMVLVACGGEPIFREGFGMANREWNVANAPDTKFRLGSITKIFTATAILQLAEQAKLSIDDPVSKYYASAPAAWQKITIKHLLTHQSGIPDYADDLIMSAATAKTEARIDRTPEELIQLFRGKALQFEPGSQSIYSNSGVASHSVV
jgi:CubicO group peptidase (beta-lactamase class C family)